MKKQLSEANEITLYQRTQIFTGLAEEPISYNTLKVHILSVGTIKYHAFF
jgi:hypothetical protein